MITRDRPVAGGYDKHAGEPNGMADWDDGYITDVPYPIFSTFFAFNVTNSEKPAEMAGIFPKNACSAIIY